MDKQCYNLKKLKDKRLRRSLIDIMGKFIGFMSGNLDEEDLAIITREMKNNTKYVEKVLNIYKKQTTILQTGLNNIRNITHSRFEKFDKEGNYENCKYVVKKFRFFFSSKKL